ncbi:hypothetical protein RRG08_008006 [Elysia crispata]|uniref:Uncharacterized protein n=1 Tax=Elysia crispata TaxID=231223 RepID=A0AAE0YT63_9GAST|nr:hypothetical protein RRG08_008006 [Elysia crispata]
MIPHSSSDSVRYFVQKFPVLTSETSLDTLLEEFSSLQCAHLPHTCEAVRKIKTDMRSSIGTTTLEALLVLKDRQRDVMSLKEPALIDRLKKAYTLSLA